MFPTPTVVGTMRQRQRGDGNVSRGQSPATSVATMVSGDEIIEDGGDHRHPQEEVPQHAWPSQAARDPVYNKDGRIAEPAPPPPPAVAGNGEEDRPQAQVTCAICIRLFAATRPPFYGAKNGGRDAAKSRMQIAQVTRKIPWQG